MIERKQDEAKAESQKEIEGVRKLIFGIGWIVILIVFAIVVFNKMHGNTEVRQQSAQAVQIACPAHVKNSVMVETPEQYAWSRRVQIPPQCDFEVFGKKGKKVDIMTYPSESVYPAGTTLPKKHVSDVEAIAFRSREKATVTVMFYPFGTLER